MSTVEQNAWVLRALGLDLGPVESRQEGGATGGKPNAAVRAFRAIKNKISPPPPKPVPRTELGTDQETRGNKLLQSMSTDDQKKVNTLLEKATPKQQKYLKKALATKHTADELQSFFDEIDGKDDTWMQNNLHVVGDSKGKGIMQQWQCSCGPTTVQAIRGELDPIYALKLHKDNPNLIKADDKDATKLNPNMAQEQKDMLEFGKGVATPRNKEGKGLDLNKDALGRKSVKEYLGMEFETLDIQKSGFDTALNDMDVALAGGLPVPVRVGRTDEDSGHFVLVTGGDPGNPRRYSIHDPWTGKTIIVDENKIKAKKLDVAGWPELTHIYKPTVIMPPDPQTTKI